MSHRCLRSVGVATLLSLSFLAALPPGARGDVYVPPALEPWRDWVLHQHERRDCPEAADGSTLCEWVSRLKLTARDSGAEFEMTATAFARVPIALPGSVQTWPLDVQVDDRSAVVVPRGAIPVIELAPGSHRISGRFVWPSLPESVQLPAGVAEVALTLGGKVIERPFRRDSRLYFGAAAAAKPEQREGLTVRVYRRLRDDVPLALTTRVELQVSGRARELRLGRAMPPGFRLAGMRGDLPARIEDDGSLRVLARAGAWSIEFDAVFTGPITERLEFALDRIGDDWPEQEVWTYVPNARLRVTRIEGAGAVDPRRAGTPFEDGSAYLLDTNARLTLIEVQRGDVNPRRDSAKLTRHLWLDFDGGGLTARDDVSLAVHAPRRLTGQGRLERVSIDGEPVVITISEADGSPGIELSAGAFHTTVISRLPLGEPFAVSPWDVDLESAYAELSIPPGWRLLGVSGADVAHRSWLSSWTLLDVFLVVVTVTAIGRLLGWPWALVAVIAVGVGYHERDAVHSGWLWLVVVALLMRLVRAPALRRTLVGIYAISVLFVALLALQAVSARLQDALYPQLDGFRPPPPLASVAAPSAQPQDLRARKPAPGLLDEVAVSAAKRGREEVRQSIDVHEAAQIGRGGPDWEWRQVQLAWDGPVVSTETMQLYLLPPPLTRALSLTVAVATLLLLAVMLRQLLPDGVQLPRRLRWLRPVSVGLLALSAVLPADDLRADPYPSPALLDELERRLLEPPECRPTCYAYERVDIALHENRLELTVEIHAASPVAALLPIDPRWPSTIRDERGREAVNRRVGEHRYVYLEPGIHEIEVAGPVDGFDELSLPFPSPSGTVTLDAPGWVAAGLSRGQVTGGALQLRRTAVRAGQMQQALAPNRIAPLVTVQRTVRLADEWLLETTVERVVPKGEAINVRVPLAQGESLLDAGLETSAGQVEVSLAPGQDRVNWLGRLEPVSPLELEAAHSAGIRERWTIDASPRWHVETEGLLPDVRSGPHDDLRWTPRPGEHLVIRVSRPTPVPGDRFAIERLRLEARPALRSSAYRVSADVLASVAERWAFPLPPGAELTRFAIDGREQPLPRAGSSLEVPLAPGSQSVVVEWRTGAGIGAVLTTPALAAGPGVSNIDIEVAMPRDRWPLFLAGPLLGPAVLAWGFVALVLVLAVLAGGVPGLAATRTQLVLLSAGMALANLVGLVVVAIWFAAVLVRLRFVAALEGRGLFNVMQIALALLTVAFLVTLLNGVQHGLLASPEMLIEGNGSQAYLYKWYADYAGTTIPSASVISLPLWAYRVLMLLWSLWLTVALLGWLRIAWHAFNAGGVWRRATANG